MKTYTQRTVNANGIEQLAAFLLKNHKRGEIISQDPAMLRAWAADAEFSMTEGNGAEIELRAWDVIDSTCSRNFTISAEGLDAQEVEINE